MLYPPFGGFFMEFEGNLVKQQSINRPMLTLVPSGGEVVPDNLRQFPIDRIKPIARTSRIAADVTTFPKGAEYKTVKKIQRREALVSNAFNVDYEKTVSDEVLYDDIVSYLGEFRFQLKKFDYRLFFGPSETNLTWRIRDTKEKESMTDKARETLRQKAARNELALREEAELRGLERLDERLLSAEEGDVIIWASPPGRKEDGYGNYGFIFKGLVQKSPDRTVHLAMTAIRVDVNDADRKGTMISKFNSALSTITNKETQYTTAENFLKEPDLIKGGVPQALIDSTLKRIFPSKVDELQQHIFQKVIADSQFLIEDVVQVLKNGTLEERIHAFTQLEGYVLELKEKYENTPAPCQNSTNSRVVYEKPQPYIRLQNLVNVVYVVPQITNSSCPIMNSGMSGNGGMTTNIMNSLGSINRFLISGSRPLESGNCPKVRCRKCGWEAGPADEAALNAGTLKACPAVIVNEETGEKEPCGWSPS